MTVSNRGRILRPSFRQQTGSNSVSAEKCVFEIFFRLQFEVDFGSNFWENLKIAVFNINSFFLAVERERERGERGEKMWKSHHQTLTQL